MELITLDSFDSNGSNWIFYYKSNKIKYYFEPYRSIIVRLLKKLANYLGKHKIFFNDIQIQYYNDPPIYRYQCVYVLN